jgi:hypothetical protein
VPEPRQHASAQPRRVRIQRRRGINPASPPISQLRDIVGEWLTGVDPRSRDTLKALDPGPRLFERSVRTLHALTVMRHWMGPPNPRAVGRSSRTLTGLHIDGQAHAKRRHRLFNHDAMLRRTLSPIHASTALIG